MSVFHRPLWRFPLWAALIVAVAAAAAATELAWWLTVVAVFAAWAVVVAVERALARDGGAARRRGPLSSPRVLATSPTATPAVAPGAVPDRGEPIESVVVVRPRDAAPEVPAEAAEPEPPPPAAATREPAPPLPDESPPPAAEPATPARGEPVRWNLWTLERIARAHAPGDDELAFLLVHLRDFADASGMLPADFDGLVRESFGDLLAAST